MTAEPVTHQREDGAPGTVPTTVVLDVGEVLIDETRVWSVWAGIVGVSPLTFGAVLGAAITQGQDFRAVFDHVAPNIDWRSFVDEYERRLGDLGEEDLYGDVRPCITDLRALGLDVAIMGNQPARVGPMLRALELGVDRIATSEDIGVSKPDPAFFDRVLEVVGTDDPEQVLYVGDRVDNDILPALSAGLRTCWLRRGPWGQLQELPDDTEPDLVLEGLGELPTLLAAWRAEVTDGG